MLAFFMPGAFELVIIGILLIVNVLPFWMICSKAGFHG